MSDVSRAEFDALAGRVTALERSLAAIAQLIAERIVPMLEEIEAKLLEHDRRFDTLEAKLDTYATQVNTAITLGSQASERLERFTRAIASHFGIDLDETQS